MKTAARSCLLGALPLVLPTAVALASEPAANAYFGAVHVHTSYSFDAYTNGTLTSPAHAYQWARGKAIPGGGGGPDLQLKQPLDFYAVADHAEWLGVFKLMEDPGNPLSKLPLAADITSADINTRMQSYAKVLRDFSNGKAEPALNDPEVNKTVWKDIVATADEYYRPGEFTTFPAFEWSANPEMRNLHRVVLFQDSQHLPERVLSSAESTDLETLWAWMGEQRDNGATLLAIPHNGNASDGLMFSLQTRDGKPLSEAYIRTRQENEPLYEITQIKGTSETNPALSPNDEFAGFEQWDYTLSADGLRPTHRKGSFARQALLDGLSFEARGMGNPFHYGFIGDSDTHNAAASNEEYNYSGKFAFENDPAHRLEGVPGQPASLVQQVREFSSGGLAGVWAQENTRESIYAAMLRRETFGTTGPQIKVRFFGGWSYGANDVISADFVTRGYAKGVPMGATLKGPARKDAPSFLVWASKAADSGNLDRIQIVKGWLDASGEQQETVYNITWSGDRRLDKDGKLPPVGNTVNVADASYSNSIGTAELAAFWEDLDFDENQPAFYYVRVLEIPTPRWSTYDAAKLKMPVPGGLPTSIQERAFSSPIWYQPAPAAGE